MGLDAGAHALVVAGAVAGNDLEELFPVYLAEIIMAAFFIPFEVRVGERNTQVFRLGDGLIHELLAQVVIAETLDLPLHGLGGVG